MNYRKLHNDHTDSGVSSGGEIRMLPTPQAPAGHPLSVRVRACTRWQRTRSGWPMWSRSSRELGSGTQASPPDHRGRER